MNIRTIWLMFALLVACAVFIPKLRAEVIAQCDADQCVISKEMLARILYALEYWHGKAQTCKST